MIISHVVYLKYEYEEKKIVKKYYGAEIFEMVNIEMRFQIK